MHYNIDYKYIFLKHHSTLWRTKLDYRALFSPAILTFQNAGHHGRVPQIHDVHQKRANIRHALAPVYARIAENQTDNHSAAHMQKQLQMGHSLQKPNVAISVKFHWQIDLFHVPSP
jgi:hypothetical protein